MSSQSIMSTSKLNLTGSQQLCRFMVRTEVVPFIRGRLSGRVCFQIYCVTTTAKNEIKKLSKLITNFTVTDRNIKHDKYSVDFFY